MEKQVIYYKDELNDEFSTAVITPKRLMRIISMFTKAHGKSLLVSFGIA